MNTFQHQIYNDLMALTLANEAFFFQDFVLEENTYRIFNYRLASYTDFLSPSALECRGIMFEINMLGEAVRLASMPMHKFFNRNENPSTMDVDLSLIDTISNKADGSLISSFLHDGEVRLKSKGSTNSDQAVAAMDWLRTSPKLKRAIYVFGLNNKTVNMEWVSPENRIVLGYLEPKLIVLNVRDNTTGEYEQIDSDDLLHEYMDSEPDLKGMDKVTFVNQIPDMLDDIEGYVVKLTSGLWMKIKTNKYLALHHCKDSVNNPRRLWEVIVNEGIDDVRSLFFDDALLIKQIDEMQVKVDHVFNSMVKEVETFYNENKHLDRKEFAIKGQQEVSKLYFSLVMNLYLGKPNDYKNFLIKHYKNFGIKDEAKEE